MLPLEARLQDIARGPAGPEIGAFFDFDDTLIDGFSAKAYVIDRLRRRQMGAAEFSELLLFSLIKHPSDADFHALLTSTVRRWKGLREEALYALWRKLFVAKIAASVYPEAWQLVQAHRRRGHTVVIASSVTRYQIAPAAQDFGIEQILSSPIEVKDGVVTGRLAGSPLWNRGKAEAVRAFAASNGVVLGESYGYANGDEDIAFLNVVGRPMALNPSDKLAGAAHRNDWPSARFKPRAKTTIEHRLRTAASYAAMATTFVSGLAAHKAGAAKVRSRNLVTSLAPELGLALGGIQLNVMGEENLWKARPAVFVFNHQSPLDLVIGVALMRRDATGVVKKEVEDMLGWGQFLKFVDAAFVDRADPEKARQALAPAVEKLKQGLSLGICPEGTRSYSPKLGAFKKGAFHMAMQAGVPMVPVVLRNAGEVMHRDAAYMRPGVVDVRVLPPVDTRGWARQTIDQHVAEVRQLFVDTLADWPDGALATKKPARAGRRKSETVE